MTGGEASYCVVLTTLGNMDDARKLVKHLVSNRLVACGTIVQGAISIYEWQDQLEEESEVLVVLKTRREQWEKLLAVVRELHPYDVPELLALPIQEGLPAYLEWLKEKTTQEQA